MKSLIVFLGLVFAAAAAGGRFSAAGSWYAQLLKPGWTPPNWIFGPVWTVLYILIALTGWRFWRLAPAERTWPLILWSIQLLCNGVWTFLFFGMRRPDLAFIDISALWLSIGGCLLYAARYDRVSVLFLVPYILWVTFAGALNLAIWRMNGGGG